MFNKYKKNIYKKVKFKLWKKNYGSFHKNTDAVLMYQYS